MTLEVFVANEQTDRDVNCVRVASFAEAVLTDCAIIGPAELSVLFVDEETIETLNGRFLDHKGATDVLSFPIEDTVARSTRRLNDRGSAQASPGSLQEEIPMLLGDVVICPEVAWRNATSHSGNYDDELALLVVHGILHLLGMDHEDPDEAEVMEAHERELLSQHHRPNGATR